MAVDSDVPSSNRSILFFFGTSLINQHLPYPRAKRITVSVFKYLERTKCV